MAAAVDTTTTAAVSRFLAGLSPVSAPVAAAAAAVCCWCCSNSHLRMFLKCAAFAVLIYAVRGYFTKIYHVSHTEPYMLGSRFLYMPWLLSSAHVP